MDDKLSKIDLYFSKLFYKMIKFAPITAVSAGISFTTAWIFGYFRYAELYQVIVFDIVCLSYFLISYLCSKIGIKSKNEIDEKKFKLVKYILSLATILQWNIISYVFPFNDFWGFAPFFVVLVAFTFDKSAVIFDIILMSISILISWLIKGEYLLPVRGFIFTENFILRIVCLTVSFSTIFALTCFGEKVTLIGKNITDELKENNKKLEKINRDIIGYTADIIEHRDVTSGSHVKRVKYICKVVATNLMNKHQEYELTESKIDLICLASTLHDIGKISIPDSILLKPSKLTTEEFNIIKTHTTKGAELIESLPESIDKEFKKYCKEIALYHHEKYDGNGYPAKLVGEEIPISAQIVSIVDCFDALTSKRPYKDMVPANVAIKMILNGECGAFSDNIKQALIDSKEAIDKII